jgi:hypothetical protein
VGGDGFLNVDLEIGARTRAQLAPLIDAFGDRLVELYCGRIGRLYHAHYESLECARDATATIHALATVIETSSRAVQRAWKASVVRDFNVGVELARGVKSVEHSIDPRALSRVVALGGRIVYTAYQVSAMRQATTRAQHAELARRVREDDEHPDEVIAWSDARATLTNRAKR